jgi:hypothetical protein
LSRLIGLSSERRTGSSEIDIVLHFLMVQAQGANGRFQDRDRDGAMTEIGAKPLRRQVRIKACGHYAGNATLKPHLAAAYR